MRHGVCYSIIREFNLNSCTLRHLDRYLEEAVERVGRILPLAAVLQRLAAVDLVKPPHYAVYAFMYFEPRPPPSRRIRPPRTMAPRTASTVVGLTSGSILHTSDFDNGVKEFSTVDSMRFFFDTLPAATDAKRLSSSL